MFALVLVYNLLVLLVWPYRAPVQVEVQQSFEDTLGMPRQYHVFDLDMPQLPSYEKFGTLLVERSLHLR